MIDWDIIAWIIGGYFTRYGVRKLTSLDPEAHRNSYYGTWSVPEIFFFFLSSDLGSGFQKKDLVIRSRREGM